jgi:hypothetical protein
MLDFLVLFVLHGRCGIQHQDVFAAIHLDAVPQHQYMARRQTADFDANLLWFIYFTFLRPTVEY